MKDLNSKNLVKKEVEKFSLINLFIKNCIKMFENMKILPPEIQIQ